MYKLNSKTQTIVEVSNTEFSNAFRLVNPNIVVSVLSGIQSIARLGDDFYATDFELLEYLRDDSDMVERCQLDMFTLNSVSFFAESAVVQDDVFSKYMRSQLVGSHFEGWPFISNIMQTKYGTIQAAYEALLDKDASDSVNLMTVCESLLNKKCCAFSFMNVIATLQRIESANVDQLLDMKIELPNNRYLKIKYPVGLLHSSHQNASQLINGVYAGQYPNTHLEFYKGCSTPFRANRAEDWCDITDTIFLVTGVYSHTSSFITNVGEPQPISCMLYVLNKMSRRSIPNHHDKLLQVHKYLLKDHYLRLIVCNRIEAEDPITSLLSTKDIFRGVNTGIKDLKSLVKFNDFLEKSSPNLKQAMILQPQYQTAMDVSSDLLAEIYGYYVKNIQLRKDTVDAIFSQNRELQLHKVLTLKQFCKSPRYFTKEPW